jgi:hypothetical protein
VLENALAAATRESAIDTIQVFLFYGANPYRRAREFMTVFPLKFAWEKPSLEQITVFITEAASRSLLDFDEAEQLLSFEKLPAKFEDILQERMAARSQRLCSRFSQEPLLEVHATLNQAAVSKFQIAPCPGRW